MSREFKPGEVVPESGIYRVIHEDARAPSHEVTCIEGKVFPPCICCEHPRFVLVQATQHVPFGLTEFKPGEKVPESGIYLVLHDGAHTPPHEVTCVEGKVFPPCACCAHPRYVLVQVAQHVNA